MSEGRLPHVEVSLEAIQTTPELHTRLADAFGFPDFYGHNWDAFRDAITGLVEMPERITFTNWAELKSALPEDAAYLQECLADLNSQFPASGSKVEYR